jgi:hypothetical protein
MACCASSAIVNLTEQASRQARAVSQARNSCVPPPESARTSTRRRACPGSCARASFVAVMWSSAVFEPAFPGRSMMASGSPEPPALWSANTVRGWNPKVFFHVGLLLLRAEVTIVASISAVISPPSAPGAAFPARAQARCRAPDRARRIAFSAR